MKNPTQPKTIIPTIWKRIKFRNLLTAFIISIPMLFTACKKDECADLPCQNGGICDEGACLCPEGYTGPQCEQLIGAVDASTHDGNYLGWNHETEDHSQVPVHIDNQSFLGAPALPAQIDLGQYFPPVGNQGQYGTCVAWACGYAGITSMEAIDEGWDPSLSVNQGSPKALFWSIPSFAKGANCNGTNFTPALDVLLNEGVAAMSLVPYTDVGTCDGAIPASWRADAAAHRLTHYRKLDNTVEAIKSQLSQNHPVIMGAKIYSNFGTLDPNGVYSTTSGEVRGGHAMIIQGYDDTKGSGAFRVRNSWGNTWNGDGTIWIDYNLMVNTSFSLESFFVISNDGHQSDPTSTTGGGPDLLPWVSADYGFPGSLGRNITMNVYNIGDQSIPASADYHNYLMYVNAYDASDFGIMYQFNINETMPANSYGCNGPGDICNFNYTMGAGQNLAQLAQGQPSFETSYVTPSSLNGDYYIVWFSDPLNKVAEANETNNIFYTSGHLPKRFVNGVSSKTAADQGNFVNKLNPTSANFNHNPYMSAITKSTRNAYSVQELYQAMKNAEETGVWEQKLNEFKSRTRN